MMIGIIIFSCCLSVMTINLPNQINYNDYGVKIAMNDLFIVTVDNTDGSPSFSIQFAPYNSSTSPSCTLSGFGSLWNYYIYTVILAKNQTQFIFAGEIIDQPPGTLVGVVKYNSSGSTCIDQFSLSFQTFSNYTHQEYYIIAAQPHGHLVYGFTNEYLYIYDTQINVILDLWDGNLTYPHPSFLPHAIDITDTYGVIAGMILNPFNSPSKYISAIYLINFNSSNHRPIVVDAYLPGMTSGSWQDLLPNTDADTYSPKYDMSVSINTEGYILVGMQYINRIFYLSVNLTNPIRMTSISRFTNGRSLGNGKSIAWVDDGIAAILVNTYTLSYQWISSSIFFYDVRTDGYNTSSSPLSVFPNNHQFIPSGFSQVFIRLVSSPSAVGLLDENGNILIINPTAPGYYPSTQGMYNDVAFTLPQSCPVGRSKRQRGVHDCQLCPSGMKNPGNAAIECLPCSSGTFCPLGSVHEVPMSALETIMQAYAYPKSPESIIFDEILIGNMFYIGLDHCLRVSPLFWTLITAGFVLIMIAIMGILKIYSTNSRSKAVRHQLKIYFKHADLINEGEYWIGGLASLCVLVLVTFAYTFSARFLKQYPIERTSDSQFACDLTLRNAKFQTTVQSLSIPVAETEKKMIELLNNQNFTLHIDFVNTILKCDVASLQALHGSKWRTARWSSCTNISSVLSLAIPLDFQQMSIQIYLADIQTIGGLRVGLSGSAYKNEHYNQRDLQFHQGFYKDGQLLTQNLPIVFQLTKVINETVPMMGEESEYSGIYIPTFTIDTSSLFLTADEYNQLNFTSTVVTIDIQETPYYVKNLQEPIAKSSEIIFHNLLFTIVCLEIFGLGFLLYKLAVKPFFALLFPRYFTKKK